MNSRSYFVWDLGGTKCAAAHIEVSLAGGGYTIHKTHTVRLTEVCSLEDMIDCFEANIAIRMSDADAVCIAGAGIYDGSVLVNANPYPFEMCFAAMAKARNWPELHVIHDYTPVICRSFIDPGQCYSEGIIVINEGKVAANGRRVAFGMGTGLGLKDGVMLPDGQLWLGHNEMGHVGVMTPPCADQQDVKLHQEFMYFLQTSHSSLPLSFEVVLSGRGLTLLHQFAAGLSQPVSPRQVQVEVAQDNDVARRTLSLYTWYLGLFVCATQLAFMPSGGMWVAGGLVERVPQIFSDDYLEPLQRGLAASPVYADFRQSIPVFGIIEPQHVLLGAAYYAHHSECIVTHSVV